MSTLKPLTIDIVSDVVCPWCYMASAGSRMRWRWCRTSRRGALAAVLPQFLGAREGISRDEYLTANSARSKPIRHRRARRDCRGEEGLTYRPELVRRQPNTTDCHR